MIAAIAKAPVDPALISTDVGSNPSDCMLELASGNTQIKYALSINRDIDRNIWISWRKWHRPERSNDAVFDMYLHVLIVDNTPPLTP